MNVLIIAWNERKIKMSQLQIFNNPEFKTSVRAIREPDGSVLFVGSDVTKMFGYVNSRKALSDHCKGVTKRDTPTDGGVQAVNCIPQGDVIRLAANSKLPGAAKFESWIFDDVIPQVLHTGSYAVQQPTALTALEQTVEVLKGMDTRIATLETKQAALEQAVTSGPKDWLTITRERIEGITGKPIKHSGLFLANFYRDIEKTGNAVLLSRVNRQRTKAKKRGATATELDGITKRWVISQDGYLRAVAETVLDKQEVR